VDNAGVVTAHKAGMATVRIFLAGVEKKVEITVT
jgi:hypothetical protein